MRAESFLHPGFAFPSPGCEEGRVESFAAEHGSAGSRFGGVVGLAQDGELVVGLESAAFGLGDDLGIGSGAWLGSGGDFGCIGPTFGLASLAFTLALCSKIAGSWGRPLGLVMM